jgi:hypothetical protein
METARFSPGPAGHASEMTAPRITHYVSNLIEVSPDLIHRRSSTIMLFSGRLGLKRWSASSPGFIPRRSAAQAQVVSRKSRVARPGSGYRGG